MGAYYYPWYADDFHGGVYLRRHLIPPQPPVLGEYDDRKAQVISQHLRWSRQAGIELWVASWWGPGSREDHTLLEAVLRTSDLGSHRIALLYETVGRTDDFSDYAQIGPDVQYIATTYFGQPNYLTINGKPVLFVYLTRVMAERGTLTSTVTAMRWAAGEAGVELYLVGDHAFGIAPASASGFSDLDAITNYDVYGSLGVGGQATQADIDAYFREQSRWQALASGAGIAFYPSVTPGFNDVPVRPGHAPLSRRLAGTDSEGSLFAAMLRGAIRQAAGKSDTLMITSWNEWHEDTQIEPTIVSAVTNRDDSETGSAYTFGLSYEGYRTRYLEVVRRAMPRPRR